MQIYLEKKIIGKQCPLNINRSAQPIDDGANRLVHLIHASELGATREATYRYDGLGRRISKTVRDTNGTTATTHYGWDGDRIVREETDNQRTTVVYEPGSFVPMLRIDDTQQGQVLSAYITDALGTPCNWSPPTATPAGRRTRRLGSRQKPTRRTQRHPTDPVPGPVARGGKWSLLQPPPLL